MLHPLPMFHRWQVLSSYTLNTPKPTTSQTPISSQQIGTLSSITPAFNDTDHSPLNVICPTYIFNEVSDFQKALNMI